MVIKLWHARAFREAYTAPKDRQVRPGTEMIMQIRYVEIARMTDKKKFSMYDREEEPLVEGVTQF